MYIRLPKENKPTQLLNDNVEINILTYKEPYVILGLALLEVIAHRLVY